jgi:hypothetical protein
LKYPKYNYQDKLKAWIKFNSLENRFAEDIYETEHLDLSWAIIDSIPAEIFQLKKLKSINLEYSSVRYLPDTLSKLPLLESLNLKCTEVEDLPKSLPNSTNLQNLNLDCSNVKTLPDTISSSKTLETLVMPTSMFREHKCPMKDNCNFSLCPIMNLPTAVMKNCSKF